MGKQLAAIEKNLKTLLKNMDLYSPALDPQITIAANYALALKKLTAELEALDCVILRDAEELAATAELDPAVAALPSLAENYRKALAALGLAAQETASSVKTARASVDAPLADDDALEVLMKKVVGGKQHADD